MHITRQNGRFIWQRRIPKDLTESLGKTPLRLYIPHCSPLAARQRARWLSVCADRIFSRVLTGEEVGTREDILRELQAEVANLRAENERLQAKDAASAQLVEIVSDLRSEVRELKQERQEKLGPLFSEAFPTYLEHRKRERDGEWKYADYTIPNAVRRFIEAIGDRHLGEYREADLEAFSFLLARVPANKDKLRLLRELTLEEAAEHNAGLAKPYTTLAKSSIVRGYLTPLKNCMEWLCTHHDIPQRWRGLRLEAPRIAKAEKPRESYTHEQLCSLFETAWNKTRPDRPEDKWLPILGFFTGARLAEMVHLQGRDIRKEGGTWIIDLTRPLIVSGVETPRQTKTTASERHIALHGSLESAGFIEFAKRKQHDQWIFPHLHQNIVNPAGTASQRMKRVRNKAKLTAKNLDFHSLRHTAKDWFSDYGFSPRDTKLQLGHTLATVEERYGRKLLRKEQLEVLRELPLPEPIGKIWPLK